MIPCSGYGAARRTVWTAIAFQHPAAVGLIAMFGMTVSGHAGAKGAAAAGDATAAAASTAVMIAAASVEPGPIRGLGRT